MLRARLDLESTPDCPSVKSEEPGTSGFEQGSCSGRLLWVEIIMRVFISIITLAIGDWTALSQTPNVPPGFKAIFNGHDLAGWYGWGTKDPAILRAMPA